MLHIVYHPQYLNYTFGPGHPFWPQRAKIFLELIRQTGIEYKLEKPQRAMDSDIFMVHTREFLQRIKQLANEEGALSIDTPINNDLLESAYWSVGGTILATRLTLQHQRAINLLGGLHHAGISDSSGFCIFNDHAIAIKRLQKDGKIAKAFVFDVDVHAGQGTQEIFFEDPSVYTLSIHQDPRTLYPGTGFPDQTGEGKGRGFNRNIILAPGSKEDAFFRAVDQGLFLLKKFDPDLTILIFGADTFKEDPLASIQLELDSYNKLGKKLKETKNLCILCAGGYSKKVPQIWLSFINGLLK